MIERCISTTRGKVYYWVSEDWALGRSTLFFFHGLTADHTMFEQQALYFAGRYNIIAWDAPAHGKSRPYDDFSLENTSADILAILQASRVERFVGIGQSFGGYCVQAFACRHSARVQAFIGIGTSPYGVQYYSKADRFWLRQVGWMALCCPFSLLKKAAAQQAAATQAGRRNMLSMLAPYGKKEYAHLLQCAYTAFLRDNHGFSMGCPVLILYGERDKTGKVRQYCRAWAKETGYPLAVIIGAGHNANVDDPPQTNRVMERFIRRALGA